MSGQNSDHSKLVGLDNTGKTFISKNIQYAFAFGVFPADYPNYAGQKFIKFDGPDLNGSIIEKAEQLLSYLAPNPKDITKEKLIEMLQAIDNYNSNKDPKKDTKLLRIAAELLYEGTGRPKPKPPTAINIEKLGRFDVESSKTYITRVNKFFQKCLANSNNILLLQEVPRDCLPGHKKSPSRWAFEKALTSYGYKFDTNGHQKHASYIITRKDMTTEPTKLSEKELEALTYLRGSASKINGKLYISVHVNFDKWDDSNYENTIKNIKTLLNANNKNTVLAGDFNTPPSKEKQLCKDFADRQIQILYSRSRKSNPFRTLDIMMFGDLAKCTHKPTNKAKIIKPVKQQAKQNNTSFIKIIKIGSIMIITGVIITGTVAAVIYLINSPAITTSLFLAKAGIFSNCGLTETSSSVSSVFAAAGVAGLSYLGYKQNNNTLETHIDGVSNQLSCS